jgi:hypothetical protein
MYHFDYSWDLTPNSLVFDKELPIHRLGWEEGDYFKLVEDSETGIKKLVKLDGLETFLLAGTTKSIDNSKKRE